MYCKHILLRSVVNRFKVVMKDNSWGVRQLSVYSLHLIEFLVSEVIKVFKNGVVPNIWPYKYFGRMYCYF